ncbi:MAG: 5'-nucleotidase [Legionella sp.]|nr:MAG: 5'-nucleotidase [Legionella sp.]PJE00266.1 MAG: 5'-nucleotidase [Legionella sp.]
MSEQKVFVNRILNMKKIKLIGLDMDHTLIRYHSEAFESLVYQLVTKQLVELKAYPQEINHFVFRYQEAIRGLVIDTKNGNILKLSRFGAIRQSYHGTQSIPFSEQQQIYRSTYVDLNDPNYMPIDTSFSIAFCVLYSQLVDLKDSLGGAMPGYQSIAADVQFCVDKVHSDGSLKQIITANLERYVIKEQAVAEGLKHYIKHGKRIFILTNSDYVYTKILLDYALTPFLAPGESWYDLFEYVITLANKPRFFYDNLRFLSIDPATGLMKNKEGLLEPGIYQGGNAKKFTASLGLREDEILYIGDHIYGDILRLKKDCNWRTALVVEELGQEIAAQISASPVEQSISDAMTVKKKLEQQYVQLYTQSIDEGGKQYHEILAQMQAQITSLDMQIAALLKEQSIFYNKKWDRIFRSGAEESYFAYQVERFACIYMEKLSDLLSLSPYSYFRSNRRLLAHDMV